MNDTIYNAILNKSKIRFTYKDTERVIEPYTYGCNFKGNDVLRGFQIQGETKNTWKLFTVEKMEYIELEDNFTQLREGYTRGDSAMQRIYIEI